MAFTGSGSAPSARCERAAHPAVAPCDPPALRTAVHVPLAASDQAEHVFQGGVQAECRSGSDAQHEPQAVGGDKAYAVNVISHPIRVFTHQSSSILAVCLLYSTRISFAQPDV